MATYGSIGEFDRGQEDWTSYCERLEQYFVANNVTDATRQRAIFFSVCGASMYQLIRNLVAPERPTDRSLAEIMSLVRDHHTPPPSVIVQRFTFHSRLQKEGESIAEYVSELRKLSEHCKFEGMLDDMLRDRLVCGVRDMRIQRRLLAEPDLKFKKAFELAQAVEIADQNAKDLQQPKANSVHVVRKESNKAISHKGEACHRCGKAHTASECRFKEAICHFCHKKGHLARVCRRKLSQSGKEKEHHTSARRTQHTHQISEEQTEDATYTMFAVSRKDQKVEPLMATVTVQGADLAMEVDTGASISIISAATYHSLWSEDQAPPTV